MEGAEKLIGLLQELSAPTVWRSVVRANEVERRLGRVGAVTRELEDVITSLLQAEPGSDAAFKKDTFVNLNQLLQQEATRVNALKELCKFLRTATPEEVANDVSTAGNIIQYYGECYKCVMEAEGTLVDMIQTIGKKLVDVSWKIYLFM